MLRVICRPRDDGQPPASSADLKRLDRIGVAHFEDTAAQIEESFEVRREIGRYLDKYFDSDLEQFVTVGVLRVSNIYRGSRRGRGGYLRLCRRVLGEL